MWIINILGLETREKQCLPETKLVLEALLPNLGQSHSRLWMEWNRGIKTVISGTLEHSDLSVSKEGTIITKWNRIVDSSKKIWEDVYQAPLTVSV